jgi:ABC-type amino acid transport system permease subunit
VGVTLVIAAISWAIAIPLGFVQASLEASGENRTAAVVGGMGNIVAQVVQIFLGIGQSQIALKLARGQPAEFGDLFQGGPRFLPVLGVSILYGVAVFVGTLACIVPGILLALMFWPCYYLVVEQRSKVFGSFSLASQITEGNKGTTFVLALLGIGINLLGLLALCIGLLFSAPLVVMIFATAYLMMSGQLIPGGVKQPGTYPA